MRKIKGALLITVVTLAGEPTTAQSPAPPVYTLTELGTLSTPSTGLSCHFVTLGNSFITGIADNGEATGEYCLHTAANPQTVLRGFRWTPREGMVDLGLPAGFGTATTVEAAGINNQGEIVGGVLPGNGHGNAFLYQRGSMSIFGGLDAGADAINNRGEVTGSNSNFHAFVYFRGSMTDLGVPAGAFRSGGSAINDQGHVAGNAQLFTPTPVAHAALWANGRWRDLGTVDGDTSAFATGVNAFDEVVGQSFPPQAQARAFLWNGAMTELPCPTGPGVGSCITATGINNDGTIVGYSNYVALVWLGGIPFDLNTLIAQSDPLSGKVELLFATSINSRGQIGVNGCYVAGPKNGECYAFIADPEGE